MAAGASRESGVGLVRSRGVWTRRRLMAVGGSMVALAGGSIALSACGANQSGAGGSEAANPSAQPATVRFHSRGGAPGSQEIVLYDEQMNLFMQKYPNIKVV